MSFPVSFKDGRQRIIETVEKNINKDLKLLDKIFCNAGFSIGKLTLPALPTEVNSDNDIHDECVRQWLRMHYGKKYSINVASDLALYMFLVDVLKIHLSDGVTKKIKKTYIDLGVIMLKRKRFVSNMEEWKFLETDKPAPTKGVSLDSILVKCVKHFGNEKILPYTLWFAIMLMFTEYKIENEAINLPLIIETQHGFCESDMTENGVTEGNLMEFLTDSNKSLEQLTMGSIDYDFTCCITLKDTLQTGGKQIRPHNLTEKKVCKPNSVISEEGYGILKSRPELKCPICFRRIDITIFEDLIPIKDEISSDLFDEPHYDASKHEKFVITNALMTDDDQSYKKLDEYQFELTSYEIEAPVVQDSLGSRTVENKTQKEFNKLVDKKYPFLRNINMNNVCIAGGFCRSILLNQQMKDFDFFITGKDPEVTFTRLLNDCQVAVKNSIPDVKFLVLFKPLHNVFEIICISDPNDFLQSTFTVDNYDKYVFKDLHRFDQRIVIDVKKNRILYLKNNFKTEVLDNIENLDISKGLDISNYFEEGDSHNIRMRYRLQIILARFNTISDIFHSFDLYPCRAAWDGEFTYLTEKAYISYKYMINIVNEKLYNSQYNSRLSKYFSYGFSIVLPYLDIEKIKEAKDLSLGQYLNFEIAIIKKNMIVIRHNSENEQKIESLKALELQNQKDDNDGYYKSSFFCSLNSILRYVKINEIPYILTDKITQDPDGNINFRDTRQKFEFIYKIKGREPIENFYGNLRDIYKNYF